MFSSAKKNILAWSHYKKKRGIKFRSQHVEKRSIFKTDFKHKNKSHVAFQDDKMSVRRQKLPVGISFYRIFYAIPVLN